jgi:hypothetical protein
MGRKNIRTEVRARENLDALSHHVNENRVSLLEVLGENYKTPAQILTEHWKWKNRATAYKDLAILEDTGRLIYYPPGAQSYRKGFKIDTTPQKSLDLALRQEIEERFETWKNSLHENSQELETLIKGLGWLAASKEIEW